LYGISLNKYISFTGKNLEEVIDEAELEEDKVSELEKENVKRSFFHIS
jgi:hypothetical protein